MKVITGLAAVLYLVVNHSYAQSFVSDDIQGKWVANKPGTELVINIAGPGATISSIDGTKLPKEILGGMMYEEIQKSGATTWTARRNAWKYSMADGSNGENGRWEKAETLTLTLSLDKNTLMASGHWTFKRQVKVEARTQSAHGKEYLKREISEDFDGTSAKFRVVTPPTRPPFIVTQMRNNTKDKMAIVLIRLADGRLLQQNLEPGVGFTKNIVSKSLEIQVIYKKYDAKSPPINLIDFVKEEIRKKVTIENGGIKKGAGFAGGDRG